MTKLNFTVDENKCVNCGQCVKCCPQHIIKIKNNVPKIYNENVCLKCQHCMAVCPVGAISILNKNPDNSALEGFNINSEDLLNVIKSRRSCRHYKHENVSKEKLDKLKEMLDYTPTGVNCRGLYFSFIDDVEVMDDFRKHVYEKFVKFIKFIPFKPAIATKLVKQIENGKSPIFFDAPHIVAVSFDKKSVCKKIDYVIALSYFELYAQSMGLGTCWCGYADGIFRLFPDVRKKLGIPKTHELGYVMLFGEKDEKYTRITQPIPYEKYSVQKWDK